jgi:hypothetical protein
LPDLTIPRSNGYYDTGNQDNIIEGQVHSDGSQQVECVRPVGTLYNYAGKVIGCSFTYINSIYLNPGKTSGFELDFYGRNYTDVASYRLQVSGNPR